MSSSRAFKKSLSHAGVRARVMTSGGSLTLFVLLVFGVTSPVARRASPAPALETVQFQSKLMGRIMPYNVLLPVDYQGKPETHYPVLYLLHGLRGHYNDWVNKSRLAEYARPTRLIIITPEGENGWYTDSQTVPTEKYESYILRELIPDVEHRYRAISNRQGRAVAGLSMGGYGALKFGLKYPERFVFAGSFSGAVGAASRTEQQTVSYGPEIAGQFFRIFGPVGSSVRKANDLFQISREVAQSKESPLPFLYLDCGTEDDHVGLNRDLAILLTNLKIPHEYRELPGKHEWPYWDKQIRSILPLIMEHLSRAS